MVQESFLSGSIASVSLRVIKIGAPAMVTGSKMLLNRISLLHSAVLNVFFLCVCVALQFCV